MKKELHLLEDKIMNKFSSHIVFNWNFLPKIWIYFAINEFQDRSEENDSNKMHTTDRAGVFKIKY